MQDCVTKHGPDAVADNYPVLPEALPPAPPLITVWLEVRDCHIAFRQGFISQ
jgi:hypothetical protein